MSNCDTRQIKRALVYMCFWTTILKFLYWNYAEEMRNVHEQVKVAQDFISINHSQWYTLNFQKVNLLKKQNNGPNNL